MAPPAVRDLVARFGRNVEDYRSGRYNETQVRREFIDPFFKCLGWDIDNEQGFAEAYKDVIHEDAIKIGGATKAPDYCFRVGGARKFFLEAKKPSVYIKGDPAPAYQLRRYAWSAKLPLSVLTDFEEFAVYDCRVKPAPADKSSAARTQYLTYEEYDDRWDDIADVFSRDAVLKGSFDKYADTAKGKRGTATVDKAFLETLGGWRVMLAQNLALRNPKLTQRELNYAVQVTLDRIIFLRMCEDRGIELYGRLLGLVNGPKIFARLQQVFREADDKYNSGLFYFTKEKGRADSVDALTPGLAVDDKVLKEIIKALYYPECPYEFSVLPAEILGQVYEQFLGQVIRLTTGHQAKVEDKPEVKKAGGVYYTPTYIVDYIVKHTVGKLLGTSGHAPKDAAKLRVLDPACGSGSFLLGAYQYLLDWHRDWYVAAGPTNHPKAVYQGPAGAWRLTVAERKRILLNNIFGVDIDPQAVEVTKLSLLLKVLEGESQDSLERQRRLFHERALPDLADNIKCGNSLIGPDCYDGRQLTMFDDEERQRINVFDWDAAFPKVMKAGGFDAVIGNPPYGALFAEQDSSYLQRQFEATTRDLDSYCLFIEQSSELTRSNGLYSMIVPTGWYSGPKFSRLRRFVAQNSNPMAFVNLPYDVFEAWVDTTVFVTQKRQKPTSWPREEACEVHLRTFPKRHRISSAAEFERDLKYADFLKWFELGGDEYLTYADTYTTLLLIKISRAGRPLGECADVQRGVTPFKLADKPTHATSRRAFAGTVRRYDFDPGPSRHVRFDHTLAEPKPLRYFVGPRLLLRELISRQFRLQTVKVTKDFVTNKSMQSILQIDGGPALSFLLGVLNSRLMSWYFLTRSQVAQRDDFPKIVLKETRGLPVPSAAEKRHDRMVAAVDVLLALLTRLAAAKSPPDRAALENQIAATDRQIDRLVYELYGLTEAEIRIVDEATGG